MFDITQVTTLTGVPYTELIARLDAELPPDAYTATPGGADLTDIDPNYMRQVLNQLFGLCGFGWGYRYSPDLIETRQETRNTRNGAREVVVAINRHLAAWYKLVMPDGEVVVCEVPSTGASENANDGYALSGAITNALGKAMSNIGFQESVYLGKRSHRTVGRQPNGAQGSAASKTTTDTATPRPAPAKSAVASAPVRSVKPAPVADEIEELETTPPAETDPAGFVIPLGKRAGEKLGDQEPKVIEWYANSLVADSPEKRALQAAAKSLLAALQPA